MTRTRLGEIQFLNASPFRLSPSVDAANFSGLEVVSAPPKKLNTLIIKGDLDISGISSACYLRNQDVLSLLPDLSISANEFVLSVLLFLPQNHAQDAQVMLPAAIPNTSETSVALMQYILFRLIGRTPNAPLSIYAPGQGRAVCNKSQAVLAIGDEALALRQHPPEGYDVIDLAQSWNELTGTPFVFGVWAVRQAFLETQPEATKRVHHLLLGKKKAFQLHLGYQRHLLNRVSSECTWLQSKDLSYYLTRALSYNLGTTQTEGLMLFEQVLHWLDDSNTTSTPDPLAKHRSDRYRHTVPV